MGLKGRRELIRKLRKRADQLVRGVALEAHGRLVKKTPVDTGRARANWHVQVGAPDRSNDPGRDSSDVERTKQQGRRMILGEFEAGESVFITNSLPYIPVLEDGHSGQAPRGMIKVTAKELKPLTRRVAAEIGRGLRSIGRG